MGFDRLAPSYAILERLAFGGALQRAREAHLAHIAAAKGVVLLGDGDGRFLGALLQAGFRGRAISVDSSGKMLRLAAEEVGGLDPQVEFVHHEALDFVPPENFRVQVISAHFFFDCFTTRELEQLLAHIEGWAPQAAELVVTDFAVPRRCGWLGRVSSRLLIWLMYRFFRIATGLAARRLPEIPEILRQRGWVERDRRESCRGLLYSSVWERR